ncbi:glycosyltransferase [Agromyces sp. MMS24-K17]|uniref:glycosyltransferase n=1 Tax=Agromyces sp. MMS24-K17 TaxID=3372850 RepID=UPI0037546FA7
MIPPVISILMLVHNAPEYVRIAIDSVRRMTHGIPYELVVLDNASDDDTAKLLDEMEADGRIDVLLHSAENTLFARGNNIAATLTDARSKYYLLLNSDVEIRSADWLAHLLSVHRRGATSYGLASDPLRLDGYCLLVDADIYDRYPLDTAHEWTWAVTKQQAAMLAADLSVQGYAGHERYLHHFGGRSGSAFATAKGQHVERKEVYSWFGGRRPVVLDLDAVSAKRRAELLSTGMRFQYRRFRHFLGNRLQSGRA